MGPALLAFIFIGASHGKAYPELWLKVLMSIGVGLWAIAALFANRKQPDVVFFAWLVPALAVLDIVLWSLRGKFSA